MSESPTPLPPLQTLRAFEAASRLASFTRAARELNVTQGAVSRQIRYLEQRLGVVLFVRIDRGVHLTPPGQVFATAVSDVLNRLAQATAELVGDRMHTAITVGATSAIASLWLMPRLTGFRRREPELDIRVLASDRDPERNGADVDVVIEYSRRAADDTPSYYLFKEEVLPVCSPGYLEGRAPPQTPLALLSEVLLQLDDTHSEWMGWLEWLQHSGVAMEGTRRPVRINNYPALLQAAIAGQGIALGWRHLVEDFLASGALIPVLSEHTTGQGAFWLTPIRTIVPGGPIARLCEWLQSRALESVTL